MNWVLLKNSLLVAGASTMLGVGLGFLVALRLAASPRRLRGVMLFGTFITLGLPPFLVVNSWLDLFGANGLLRSWLPFPLFSLAGTIAVLTSLLWPLSTLLILGAWDRVEAAQLESDPRLRGGVLIRWVLWPAARGAVGLATVLTFVLAFNQFTVPVILQVPVFPEELWLALTTRLNHTGAWAAAAPMVLVPTLLLLAGQRQTVAWPRMSGPHRPAAFARQLGPAWCRFATIVTVGLLGLSLLLPLGQLLAQARTWVELPGLIRASREVVTNSFVIAFLAATMCLAAGVLVRRWRSGWVLWLLFFVPGILLSQLLIRLLGGTVIYGTLALVLVAFVLRYAAIGWQGAADAEQGVDRDLVDVGRVEGVRGWALFRHYAWPQLARPLAATWYVIYLLALWEVETLVLIYPPGGDTLPLRIFQLLHYGHNAQVNAMCVVLLGLAIVPLLTWHLGRFVIELRRGG